MLKAAHLIGAGFLILSCVSAAEARHFHYYWPYQWNGRYPVDRTPDNDGRFGRSRVDRTTDHALRGHDPRFADKRSGSTLGLMIDQLIGTCAREVVELRRVPAESTAGNIRPDSKQGAALEELRRIAEETATTLAANCPRDVERLPSGRLDALIGSLDAVETALDTLQPPLQTLYSSLGDEHKVGLVATSGMASSEANRYDTSRVRRRSRDRAGADRETLGETLGEAPRDTLGETRREPPPEAPQAPPQWNCEQWGAELRAWPVTRVEEIVQPGPRQRAAFYELAASFQHAADLIADTCPSEPDTGSPLGRITQIRKKIDAVRQSIAIIRPALGRFDEMLDAGQRKRLREAM